MNFINSKQHSLSSVEVNKIALSAHDDKRIIAADGVHTYAHGHYKHPH